MPIPSLDDLRPTMLLPVTGSPSGRVAVVAAPGGEAFGLIDAASAPE